VTQGARRPQEIVFYSEFPFGYQNPEAEDRMLRFAARGHRVRFVEGLGIRNPRLQHLRRALRMLSPRRRGPRRQLPENFTLVSPRLLPPRRAPLVGWLNRRWLARQILRAVDDPGNAVFWVRFPTPELTWVVQRARPRLVVYELADEHRSAKLKGRLLRSFDEAELQMLSQAKVALASSAALKDRLDSLHRNVHLSPAAAVDVEEVAEAASRVEPRPARAVYIGGIDHRFDAELLAEVAGLLPDWRFEMAGPAQPAVQRRLSGVPNVELLGRLPPDELPELIAAASVCLMPYKQTDQTDTLFPIKLILYLSTGRPVVSTPLRSAREFADVVSLAPDAASFAAAIKASPERDDPASRRARIERARPYSWSRRIEEMEETVLEALGS
jgi:glycosyltransferase involved in cell wall biosynthesis